MYKSQFKQIDPYDWFCGPGSHMYVLHYRWSVSFLFFSFLDINTFIQQWCFKLLKSDSKNMYNVTKNFCTHF